MPRVAINGLGRIGRATLKILLATEGLELVAVNELIPTDNLAYLLNHDSVYRPGDPTFKAEEKALVIGDRRIPVTAEKDPSALPWGDLDIDLVFECTGVFRKEEQLRSHLDAGARRVILSAPEKSGQTPTVVHGVNEAEKDARIISCASCTTNCIAPVAEIMYRQFGVSKATMTTVHAYTSSQNLVDGPKNKWRRGRAAAINFVPTSTGAAKATTKVLDEYADRFDGVAVRGPVPSGSLADMVFVTRTKTSNEGVNDVFREEAESESYKGVLGVTEIPLVSSDIVGDARASIVDLTMTQVVADDLVKVMSWYDNEWGYSAQMVREAVRWLS